MIRNLCQLPQVWPASTAHREGNGATRNAAEWRPSESDAESKVAHRLQRSIGSCSSNWSWWIAAVTFATATVTVRTAAAPRVDAVQQWAMSCSSWRRKFRYWSNWNAVRVHSSGGGSSVRTAATVTATAVPAAAAGNVDAVLPDRPQWPKQQQNQPQQQQRHQAIVDVAQPSAANHAAPQPAEVDAPNLQAVSAVSRGRRNRRSNHSELQKPQNTSEEDVLERSVIVRCCRWEI